MKTKVITLAMAFLIGMGLLSCSKSDNKGTDFSEIIPEAVRSDFQTRFPSVNNLKWEQKGNILKAEFNMNKVEFDAWYQNSGTWAWIRTEQDVNNIASIPQSVQNHITANYSGWRIDDIDFIQVPGNEFYEIELEKAGERDVILLIKGDGTLINTFIDNDDNDHIAPSNVPAAVITAFESKYPTAVRVKWEIEGKLYEAEFLMNNQKYDAYFNADGSWVYTEIEKSRNINTLPAAIQNYITTNYSGWGIDDVDLVQTPSDEYYKIELEKGAMEVTLRIKADGTIVTI